MNITLTLQHAEVMQHLGPLVDRLIDGEHEITAAWYAFSQYLELCLGDLSATTLELPFYDKALYDMNREFMGSSCTIEQMHHAFNGLYGHIHHPIMTVFQKVLDNQMTVGLIDGFWEEPMAHFHPVLVFKSTESQALTRQRFLEYWEKASPHLENPTTAAGVAQSVTIDYSVLNGYRAPDSLL